MTQQPDAGGPLAGVRVLDLSWFGAGPIGGRALASAGADVIKVETVKRIDGLRAMAPRPRGARGYNLSGYFNNYNADKRSVTIDLTTERGHELGLELVRWADVMLTNMTNRAVGQVGMGWDVVSRENPRLVAAYMPMMGTTGPFKDFQGFGAMLTAICGMNYLAGFEENRPVGVGTNYPDYVVNPMHAYIAMLAALRHARKTGEGQMIDVSQYESSVAAMSLPLFQHDNG
ncbi:MAG: CoA transferase, partial [Gammaproteobacteria bacterium]|nr:CoA transferase [Gammaproteobacteria bacterium]